MADEVASIKIIGKLSYEDEITLIQAARIIEFLNSDSELTPPIFQTPGREDDRRRHAQREIESPRAAIDAAGAKTNPQKIVALGAYLLQDGGDTFKIDAIKSQFQRAREVAPGNMSRDLATAISNNWIAESDATPGEYYLTHAISNVLEEGFPTDNASRPRRARNGTNTRARRARPTSKKGKPEAFAGIDEFNTVIDGAISYHDAPNQKDKILWALWFAKQHEIKGLVHSDIAWITDQLGDGVPSKHIGARIEPLKKAGYVTRSTVDETYRITPSGESYVTSMSGKQG